jgi:DNA-binding HxlR family transcriptional regulator
MFWLRNRRHKQWREQIELEHSVTDEKLRELEEAGLRARNGARR